MNEVNKTCKYWSLCFFSKLIFQLVPSLNLDVLIHKTRWWYLPDRDVRIRSNACKVTFYAVENKQECSNNTLLYKYILLVHYQSSIFQDYQLSEIMMQVKKLPLKWSVLIFILMDLPCLMHILSLFNLIQHKQH